jgi:hypothetical protein
VCTPVPTDNLQFRRENCEWGCDSNIDTKLRLCETLCHLETVSNKYQHDHETQCQEICAIKYLKCLEGCKNIMSNMES